MTSKKFEIFKPPKNYPMLVDFIILILSLAFILYGANFLTDGAAALAGRMGVSDLIVGLTVVAFGTSTPELVISLFSAIRGADALAIGNIVGSNIINILIIIGVSALITPLKVTKGVLTTEIPMVIMAAFVLLVMGNGPLLDGSHPAVLTRIDGIILLVFFIIFMRHTFQSARRGASEANPEENPTKKLSTFRIVIYILGGLAALVAGGEFFVRSASSLARDFGISEAVIGLTIVALGSSLPELATSVSAALKGKPGMAVGNVIGSNIFNIFMVLGITSTVRPVQFGNIGNFDLITLLISSILFWIFGWFYKNKTITRLEGAILVGVYIAYLVVLLS